MPEKPAQERTEKPTADRLRKARERGNTPQCRELPSALVLAAMLGAMALLMGDLWTWLQDVLRDTCSLTRLGEFNIETAAALLETRGTEALKAIFPFMLTATGAGVLGSLVGNGWSLAPKAVAIKPEHVNPVEGLKNLVSLKSLVTLATGLAKLGIIIAIVVPYLTDELGVLLAMSDTTAVGTLVMTGELIFGVVARIAVALALVAIADTLYQRWQYKKNLRMTKQEVKEETKEHELSPEVRGHLRNLQYEMVRKRMLQDVPEADVVVVNPEHVAVALKYDEVAMGAPEVVAKGADLLCEKIKDIARTHAVPIVRRPELARTMYRTVEVGEPIPDALFVAVAEVLALIYRMRRQGRTPTA